MKKQLVTAGLATAVGLTGVSGFAVANAATDPNGSHPPVSGLVEAIATKFNLKKADVQSVFDAQHTKMEADREAKVKAEVSQLVTDGKLTQDQADKINAKRAELKADHDAQKDSKEAKTRDERKAEMDAKRSELETWAKDNGIDTQYLKYVVGGPGHGPGMHGMHDMDDDDTPAASTSSR